MDDAEITKALCRILALVPGWQFEDHEGADLAIFYGAIGTEPDRAIGVRVYGQPLTADGRQVRRAQLRTRGSRGQPDDADYMAGVATSVLEGISRQYGINGITHLSSAPAGADTNLRDERTDNFLIIIDNPEASR